jgi:hypothetical protein
MQQDQIQVIDANIKKAKKLTDFAGALERLQMNKDFKTVIQGGYFQDEAVRLVHLKADQNFQSADAQRSIVQQMDAIGALHQFFQTVFHKSNMAQKSIEADEATREEILAEDALND